MASLPHRRRQCATRQWTLEGAHHRRRGNVTRGQGVPIAERHPSLVRSMSRRRASRARGSPPAQCAVGGSPAKAPLRGPGSAVQWAFTLPRPYRGGTALQDRPQGPPTANCQPPPTATNHQPSNTASRHRSPTSNRQPPPTTNRQPPTAANRDQPPTANRQPPTFEVENHAVLCGGRASHQRCAEGPGQRAAAGTCRTKALPWGPGSTGAGLVRHRRPWVGLLSQSWRAKPTPLAQARPRSQKSGQNGGSTPTPCLDKAVHARDTCDSQTGNNIVSRG